MLARSERQLVRRVAAHRGILLTPQGARGIALGRRRNVTDNVVRILAINYAQAYRSYNQVRSVATETRTPDTKPFPLPNTTPPSQSNARSPPPPMPPQPPRTEEMPRKPTPSESSKSSSATNADPAEASPTQNPQTSVAAQADAAAAVEKKDKDAEKKLTIWQKVKKEAAHYWDGTKLLGKEIRISFRLALKMAAGYELSRRESRQLKRTTEDLIRLVPFSVFVIVPFAELLLPVALKLFPNMLPSTYEGETAKEAKRQALRKTRMDVSNFLRTTIQESGLYLSKATKQSDEFAEFFRKVRTSGETPSDQDVIEISKIFRDDLTLDNLSRAQLIAMSRYMNLSTFGTDTLLRYQLRHHLLQIKRDDRAIAFEGVNSLSVPELQMAAAARGILTQGVSPAHLRDDLQQWLDLRLKDGVPSTLLVLSNAYAYGREKRPDSHIDNLRATLSCLTDELFHEAELEVHHAEGAATNRQRLEVLEEQEELIEDENKQEESVKETTGTGTSVKDVESLDDKEEAKRAEEESERAEEAAEAEEAEKEGDKAEENQKKEPGTKN